MIKNKEVLDGYLNKALSKYGINKKVVSDLTKYLVEQYNFSLGEASDLLTQRTPLETENIFSCFCLVDALSRVDNKIKLVDWFTEKEISAYKSEKIDRNILKFPLKIPAIQITDDQWIGYCDCEFLMKLRNAQKIFYNTNTQRTLQRVLKNGRETYKIALNATAVREIIAAYENETYISDTISFNLSADADYWYNQEKRELVIDSLDHFDIIDGFHRYTAMCKEVDSNPDFNYPMELRIVQFDEAKAKRFIWQQDQKTKMKKIDSESMNSFAPQNIVVEKLNQNPMFNYHGAINRNGGSIAFQDFANVIGEVYFKTYKKTEERKLINQVVNELKDKINYISDSDPSLIEHQFSRTEITVLVIVLHYLEDYSNAADVYKKTLEKVLADKDFTSKLNSSITKPRINKIVSMMKGE